MAVRDVVQAAAGVGGEEATYVEDVFSTYLYTGNGSTQSIENGIALGDFGVGTSTDFDGTSDYLSKFYTAGAFSSSSKTFTFSAWFYWDGTDSNTIFQTPTFLVSYNVPAGNVLTFSGYSDSYSTILGWDSVTAINKNTWNHVLISIDLNNSLNRYVYINDALVSGNYNTYVNSAIGFSQAGTATVSSSSATWSGRLAHVFLDTTYRDLSVEANRRLFIDANGGSTAPSTLSALSPILYLPMTEDYSIGENLGTGGDFTVNGSPTIVQSGTQYEAGYGQGGLTWIKQRSATRDNLLFDTTRGATQRLFSNLTLAQSQDTQSLTAFNSDGFSIGSDSGCNISAGTYASWTFRKAPKFFDVVTFTGNGAPNRVISHNLGSTPGCLIVKSTSAVDNWYVWHRSLPNSATGYLKLNTTDAQLASGTSWFTATSTTFTIVNNSANTNGVTYVAYLFAHDAGGFGDDGEQNVISCGSYVGNNVSGGQFINLGYEPQWVLTKNTTGSANDWHIQDVMRGATVPSTTYSTALGNVLRPNSSIAEYESTNAYPAATGFYATGDDNNNGTTYIYIAIRRPMKTPESGTEVFAIDYQGTGGVIPGYKAPFPVDMGIWRDRDSTVNTQITTRMTHDALMYINLNNEETTSYSYSFDYQNGFMDISSTDTTRVGWMFRRAPGFFDVVGYKGDGIAGRTVTHNLGVAPELMIIKNRGQLGGWRVYYGNNTRSMLVNNLNPGSNYVSVGYWNNTSPTSSVFTLGVSYDVNSPNVTNGYHIAYLFATLPGVSKVGSYTGTAATQTIDCGFSSGARFVLIKREDSYGDWYLWDSLRGIVAGNDPYLLLNLQDAETTTTDYIDPVASGFQISSSSTINGTGGNYIFLAIA